MNQRHILRPAVLMLLLAAALIGGWLLTESIIKQDPIVQSLDVTNHTDAPFTCNQSWAVDKGNVDTTIDVGHTATLASNSHSPSGTVINCWPHKPTVNVPAGYKGTPEQGLFTMRYSYEPPMVMVCDNACSAGSPTPLHHYQGQNWLYETQWTKDTKQVFNAVIIKTTVITPTDTDTTETSTTFKPSFVTDYTNCGDVILSEGSVQIGDASTSCGGRIVSNQGYKNISQIRFTADLSNVSGNFVTSTFYMVNNPTNPSLQPKGDNYCDAGGNKAEWNCQETDFFEVNKNVVFQHTMHIGDGSASAPQNYQLSYSTTTDQCFQNLNPSEGLVSWNGIDIKQPVDFVVDLDDSGMTVTVKQGSISTVVYTMGDAYPGSTVFDDDQIKRWGESRAQGYWLNLSRWQNLGDNTKSPPVPPWSPGSSQNLYNWNGQDCGFGNVCGANSPDYFKVYAIEIDAESTL